MKYYVIGIQRAFARFCNYKIQILSGPIFCCLKEGILAVIDTKIRSLQAEGIHTVSHNVLFKEYIIHLISSVKQDPSVFQA